MKSIIEVNQLRIIYQKSKVAVDDISFSVSEGEIFGILGPNGAGKTTLIKAMSTMLLPSAGSITVLGFNTDKFSNKIRKEINFVYGGEKGFYEGLTPVQYLTYFCSLYKIKSKCLNKMITDLLERVNLFESKDIEIYKFSKGMKQRLHLARALINSPKILFFDEPTVGLDPEGVATLRKLIRNVSEQGVTVVLCTHDIKEAQDLCDRVAFFSEGKISSIETPKEMIRLLKDKLIKLEIVCKKEDYELLTDRFLLEHSHRITKNRGYYTLEYFSEIYSFRQLEERIQRKKIGLVRKTDITLEDAYLFHYDDLEVYKFEKNYK